MSAPKVGAFFDLDGTLIPKPSVEWRFLGYLLARDEITSAAVLRWLGHCAKTFLENPRAAADGNKFYLAGLRESLASEWANSLEPESLEIFCGGLARIWWHVSQRHQVFLVSGTLAPLGRAIARSLPGQVGVIATELEVYGDRWTGRLAGEHMSGKAKCRTIRTLATQRGLQIESSYAYGDQIADLGMLESVGHPFGVNPSLRLRRIARRRRWPICNWASSPAAQCERAQWLAREAR